MNERTLFVAAVVVAMIWIGVSFGLEIARKIPNIAARGAVTTTVEIG